MLTTETLVAAATQARAEVGEAERVEALAEGQDITVGLSELVKELNAQNVNGVGVESLALAHVAMAAYGRRSGVPIGLTIVSLEELSDEPRHQIDTVTLESLVDTWEWTNRQLALGRYPTP